MRELATLQLAHLAEMYFTVIVFLGGCFWKFDFHWSTLNKGTSKKSRKHRTYFCMPSMNC